MPAFLVSTVRITDAERFGRYAAAIAGLIEEHGGRYVVRGPVSAVLEGATDPDERVVVAEFANVSEVHGYLASPRYVAAKALRAGAGEVDLRLVVA